MFRKDFIWIGLLAFVFVFTEGFAQSQSGFYDEFDLDLWNVPQGPGEDRFQIYRIPPAKKNNFPVTPKKVRRYYEPLAGFPGAGTGSVEQLGNQGTGRAQSTIRQNNFINPITGEINYEAAEQSFSEQDRERERRERDKKRFTEEEVYKESKARRFQIIFFLTMPVAFAASAGAATLLGIERAISGSVFMISGTLGLSGANAYQDLKRLDEYKQKKGTEWHDDEDDEISVIQ